MPKISDIEETPNPNAVKFVLREPVSNGVAQQFASALQAENDPLAKSLFEVGHVVSVFYMDRMITVETGLEIHRPVEVVFAFATDFRHAPQWQETTKEVYVTPNGPPIVGTKATQVASFLGMKLEATNEITALEPNRSFSFKGTSGPAELVATTRFEATGAGTRLSGMVQMEPGGLFKVAGPLLAGQLKKQLEGDLQRLKALLEAQG